MGKRERKDEDMDPDAKTPFDILLDEIGKILAIAQTKQLISDDELQLPEDLDKRLEELRKKIDKFVKVSDDIVRLSDVSKEEMKMRLEGLSTEIPPQGKRLIQRSKELHAKAQDFSEKLNASLRGTSTNTGNMRAAPQAPSDDKPRHETKRKSKFKRFGSDKNWKPL